MSVRKDRIYSLDPGPKGWTIPLNNVPETAKK
jgi:hypothetical protein